MDIKVIKINSPYQIVLNCGLEQGNKLGQRFLIYGLGEMMKDPDSGEVLEQLEIVRGTGKITHLQQKICTVESTMFEETPKTIKRTKGGNTNIFGYGTTEEQEIIREKLSFEEVQIGDKARPLS